MSTKKTIRVKKRLTKKSMKKTKGGISTYNFTGSCHCTNLGGPTCR